MKTSYRHITIFSSFLIVLISVSYFIVMKSKKLTKHIASLECKYVDMNEKAREYYRDYEGDIIYAQLRRDWINDIIIYSTVGESSENGIGKQRILQEKTDVYYQDATLSGTRDARFTIDRETLITRIALIDKDTKKEALWIELECKIVDASVFEQKRKEAADIVKAKQKI